MSIDDQPRFENSSTAQTDEHFEKIHEIIVEESMTGHRKSCGENLEFSTANFK